MGLLDFISKSTGDDQSGGTTSTQTTPADDSQGTQPTTQLSDVQYPIPNQNSPLQPIVDFSQNTFDPSKFQSQEIPQTITQEEVLPELPDPIVNNQVQMNSVQEDDVEDLTKYAPSSSTFDVQPQPSQEESVSSSVAPQDSNSFMTETQNEVVNDIDTDLLNNQVQEEVQMSSDNNLPQEIDTQVSGENNVSMVTDSEGKQNQVKLDIPENQVTAPVLPSADIVTGNDSKEMNQEVVDTNPIIEDSNATTQFLNTPEESNEKQEIVEEPVYGNQIVMDDPEVKPEENSALLQNQITVLPSEEVKDLEVESETLDTSTEEEIQPIINVPQAPEIVEENHELNQEENYVDSTKYTFKKIKNIAFLGLNSKTFNNVSSELKSLAKLVAESGVNVLIDANKAYGDDVLTSLENVDNVKVTAVHFKPFYSNYSDEMDRPTTLQEYTTVVYSDLIEKLKYFIRESEAFVIPETSGLINFSTLTLLLSLQFLYHGQNKPVVLLGNKWSSKLDQFKLLSNLSEEEFSSIRVALNANEAMEMLRKEDEKMSSESKSKTRKFYDFREDFDEYEYMN